MFISNNTLVLFDYVITCVYLTARNNLVIYLSISYLIIAFESHILPRAYTYR